MAGRYSSRISGIEIQIGGDTSKLTTALKGVDAQLKTTRTNLNDINKLLKLDPGNTELLVQKQKNLQESIKSTKERLAELKSVSKDSVTPEQWDALHREIVETEKELKNLQTEYRNFGSVAGQKIQAVGTSVQNAGKKISSVGDTLTKSVTLPIVGIGTAAVKVTADFDESMGKVSAISGATGKDLDSLRKKAREMGQKTKFSASEAADAMTYMGMAGWKTTDMIDGLEGIMNLAAASGEDLATTSDIVTDGLTAFGLSAKDSGRFADVLAAASSNANTNVSMMGESFKYAAPVAGTLGIKVEDTAVAIGLMANSGIKASQAGTSLRTGLTNLAKPTKQMKEYMDKYNIALVENDDGSINLRATMVSLREKIGALSESEQAAAASAIFGKDSMAGWLAVVNSSDKDFNKLTKAIDNCDGSAENMAKVMNDNLNGQLTILLSQLQELAISFGEILVPVIRKVVSKVQDFVTKLNSMDSGTKEMIVKIAALVAALGPVLSIVGRMTTGGGTIIKGIGKVVGGIGSLGTAIMGGGGLTASLGSLMASAAPFLIGGAVVVGIIAAVVLIVKNWDKIKNAAKKLGDSLGKTWNSAKKGFTTFVNGIRTTTTKGLNAIRTGVSTGINAVRGVVTKGYTGIKSAATTGMNAVKNVSTKAWTAVKNGTTTTWNGIRTTVSGGITKVSTTVTNGWAKVRSSTSTAWSRIAESVSSGASKVGSRVSAGWSSVQRATTSAWSSIRSGVSSSWSSIQSSVSSFTSRITSRVSSAFGGLKNTISAPFRNITSTLSGQLSAAVNAVSNAAGRIRGLFNFELRPKIKLPSVRVTWMRLFGSNIKIPRFSISWYRKAYENAVMFNRPTVMSTPDGLKGFGDGPGGEIVLGKRRLQELVADAAGNTYNYGDTTIIINPQPGQNANEIADQVQKRLAALQKQKERAIA